MKGSLDAVIGAIRRYDHGKHEDIFSTAHELLGRTINIFTRKKVAEISLKKDEDVQKLLPRLFDIIQYIQGDVLRIMQANESIRLLIDEKNLEEVIKIFPKHKMNSTQKNLAEIDIYIQYLSILGTTPPSGLQRGLKFIKATMEVQLGIALILGIKMDTLTTVPLLSIQCMATLLM